MAKGSWDELLKLINKYLRGNKDKEGVLKLLTRKDIGDLPAIGIRFRNPINETQYSLANKGMTRDRQYYLFKTYEKDIFDDIMKVLKKIDDEGIKLGREQLKNLEYNVGILKMLRTNNIKSADVLRKDGKDIAKVMKTQGQENFVGDTGIMGSLEDKIKELKKLADEMKPENIAKKEAAEKAAREKKFKKLWHGRAYEGRSDMYRGLSYQLAKLHEAGIIKLDDEIYKGLKEGKYHWGGADMFAPDPPRIWRYHFGDKIFDKFDEVFEADMFKDDHTFIGPTAMEDWMKANNIKPIKVDGPKNALDYMDEVELIAHAEDAQDSINIFKGDDHFYSNIKGMSDADKAKNTMNAIVQNAENKKAYLDALKRNYPEAYNKMDWKTAVDTTDPAYKQDDTMDSVFKVISEGDEGWDEISKKLGITARPGDKVELESNVIEGPWKGSTKASKLDESKYATDKEFKSDLRSTMLNVVENNPDFNLEIIERLKKEGDRIYSPYGEGKLLSPDQRQKVLKEIKKVMTDADYQQQWGIEAGTYTDDMFKIDIEEVGKTSKPVVKETVSETIDISKLTDNDLNKLVDELNMNQGKMAEVDSTGGTKIGYEEFKKLEARNDAIEKALAEAKKMYEELGKGTGNFQYDYQLWKQKFGSKTKTTAPGTFTVSDHIAYIKTLEPVEAMKEVNKVLKGEGRYKGISKADQDQIFTDTDDWVNQRDLSDRWDYKNNRPYRDDPNFDPDDPDYDPDEGLYAEGGIVRLGFDGGGDPLTRLKNQIVEGMKPYAPGISEDRLWIIVKDITLDMSPEEAQASAIANFKKNFAKGGRVGYSSGGNYNYHWGHGSVLDPDFDEGFDMEETLRLLKQDQSGNQGDLVTGVGQSDLEDLLERLRMVVEGLGIYSDYNQDQRKQMQRSLTNRINVLLGS